MQYLKFHLSTPYFFQLIISSTNLKLVTIIKFFENKILQPRKRPSFAPIEAESKDIACILKTEQKKGFLPFENQAGTEFAGELFAYTRVQQLEKLLLTDLPRS